MIIAVNHVSMPDRLPLPDGWEVWETTTPTNVTYADLAAYAVSEMWDKSVVVVQDDVRFTVDPLPTPPQELVVYGQTVGDIVCPRAFAASSKLWAKLAERWNGRRRVCGAWMPLVQRYAVVLDVTEHLEPVGARNSNHGQI